MSEEPGVNTSSPKSWCCRLCTVLLLFSHRVVLDSYCPTRPEYWPTPGDLSDPGIKPTSHVACISSPGRQILYSRATWVALCKCPDGALLLFWFAFLWWLMMLSIFSWAYRSFVYILWRNVYLAPLPIQKNGLVIALLLSCNNLLYTLEPSPLSDKWFADVFFPFMSICWWYPLIKKAF